MSDLEWNVDRTFLHESVVEREVHTLDVDEYHAEIRIEMNRGPNNVRYHDAKHPFKLTAILRDTNAEDGYNIIDFSFLWPNYYLANYYVRSQLKSLIEMTYLTEHAMDLGELAVKAGGVL